MLVIFENLQLVCNSMKNGIMEIVCHDFYNSANST
jgi:hypothetical protein